MITRIKQKLRKFLDRIETRQKNINTAELLKEKKRIETDILDEQVLYFLENEENYHPLRRLAIKYYLLAKTYEFEGNSDLAIRANQIYEIYNIRHMIAISKKPEFIKFAKKELLQLRKELQLDIDNRL